MNFVKHCLLNGGIIKPLLMDHKDLCGPAICNPSVIVLNDNIIVNLRNVNYTLYHAEKNIFEHYWGPLVYMNPEDDPHLITNNYIAKLDDDLNVLKYAKIDTSEFDNYEPQWEFIGLEDGRLIEWNDKIYLIGVRRDLDTVGTGRMELSELEFNKFGVKEVSRYRVPGPPPDNEYCMKNCTPVEGMPYTLMKWTNPTVLMDCSKPETVVEQKNNQISGDGYADFRGGSQVIEYGDGYLTIIHETRLEKSRQGRKNGKYRHRFVYWDENFQFKKVSKLFSFLDTRVEFCCGLARYHDDLLITFSTTDNAAFILRVSRKVVEEYIN